MDELETQKSRKTKALQFLSLAESNRLAAAPGEAPVDYADTGVRVMSDMNVEAAYQELTSLLQEGESLRDNVDSEKGLTWKHLDWGEYCKSIIAYIDPHGEIFDKSTPVGMFYDAWNLATFHWVEEKITETTQIRRNVEGFAQAVGALRAIVKFRPHPRKPKRFEIPTQDVRGSDVFLIHGHDHAARETVARFLEALDLTVCILHEQPNLGRTIIEKFEQQASAGFAVALLTADDLGANRESPKKTYPRARQNVIFEFGYFMGRLGRKRVCALVDESVERPSDLDGLVYIALDPAGGWKLELAKNIKHAGIELDLNKAISFG